MTKTDKSENLLPFDVIVKASAGNTSALCQVVEHYDNYIATLCTRVLCDE